MIRLSSIRKIYGTENRPVLNDIDLFIREGEACAITGQSGSGKSSLLSIIGLLDQPTAGSYYLNGVDTSTWSAAKRAHIRSGVIGFVFQAFHLLPRLSVFDNVALPLQYLPDGGQAARDQVVPLLEQLGLKHYLQARPSQLSGGQQQRVAIARALVCNPQIILADEPTGNLDSTNAHDVMQLLLALNRTHGTTLVTITHDPAIAHRFPRCISLQDGRILQ